MLFAVAHYAALAVFVAASWGWGQFALSVFSRLAPPRQRDGWLETLLATTLGVGIFVCLFQWLAIAHLLTAPAVLLVVALGFAAACALAPSWIRELRQRRDAPSTPKRAPLTGLEKVAFLVFALVLLPKLVDPLAPPYAFDELMYHLPYARQVAQTGSLGIHDWLRYPWFPYNYQLLYAGALLVGDDVLPHFLNMLAGLLAVGMLYRVGVQHATRLAACAGAAILLGLGDYSNALIDLSVALFVLAACIALWWWRESPGHTHQSGDRGTRWLALAAFFLGVAAGAKYQALVFLPLVFCFVVWRERRLKPWLLALCFFLLPCAYWFGRNLLLTGDPFNPIGARLFGFSNWNPADYTIQLDDVQDHATRPNLLIWAVLLAPFGAAFKRSPAVRAAVVFCAYSIAVWAVTSRYPRYLTASFPLIAWVSAIGWGVLFGWLGRGMNRVAPTASRWLARPRIASLAGVLLLATLAAMAVQRVADKVELVAPTPAERDTVLRGLVPGYVVMDYLHEHAQGRVYQIGLIDALYYGPNPMYGDMLGPWRYADYVQLPPAQLSAKLAGQGFGVLVMADAFSQGLVSQPDFGQYFEPMIAKDGASAYRVLRYAP